MAIKKFMLSLMLALFCIGNIYPQTVAEVTKNINKIKLDTMYISAETTMKDLNEAYEGARAILEVKVGDWVRRLHPHEAIELCIVKAKEHCLQLETRRGDLFRAFVYVRKTDILPVADKSEVTVLEVGPVTKPEQPKPTPAIMITEETPPEVEKAPTIELTPEEKQMCMVKNFYGVEPYIKDMESKGRINKYGKYATLPAEGDCHLFVYDKQGKIAALIRRSGTKQYNLNSLKEDNVKNYKNCGAFWFQLKK